MRVVKRAYKYRFYPTPQQAELLNRTFGSVRYVYNRALAERSRAWTHVNAAKVICAEGLSVQACGDGVRPPRT